MQLYTFDPAPNPRRVSLFLAHKQLEIETVQVDLMAKEQLGESFLQINPLGTVPALVLDDGTVLTEVIGICDYLEALHPENPLMGRTPLERALVLSWDHRLFVSMMMAIAEALRNVGSAFVDRALPGPLPLAQIPALAERGHLRLQHGWPQLDRELAGREFLVGDSLTFADIDLLVITDFAAWVKEPVPDTCTALHAWKARVQAALNGA